MVKRNQLKQFFKDVEYQFGFLIAQQISLSPLTPKDTSRMAMTFPSTFEYDSSKSIIKFTTPFYTEYVISGTRYMEARPFIIKIFNLDGERLLKQSFRIINKKYK